VVTSGRLIAGLGSVALGVPLTGTGSSRPAPPGGAPAAPPGCCCGPCDMTGGVIGPAALGAPLTATGTGRTPQAHPGCCCGPWDMTGGVIGPAAIGTGWTAPPGGPPQADPGCCCGPCDMTGGVIGPAAIGTGWTAPPGGPPQADPGCCCGSCDWRPKSLRRRLNRWGESGGGCATGSALGTAVVIRSIARAVMCCSSFVGGASAAGVGTVSRTVPAGPFHQLGRPAGPG
jgi:hypothetical protein